MAWRGTKLADAKDMLPKHLRTALFSLLLLSTSVVICGQETVSNHTTQSYIGDDVLIRSVKEGNLERVVALVAAGASPDATDGGTALCWAIRTNCPDIVGFLLAQGATVDKEEDDGGTTLDVAAATGRAELAKLLLEHGADSMHKDKGGHTPLMSAAMGTMFKEAPALMKAFSPEVDNLSGLISSSMGSEHQAVVRLLLDAGADGSVAAEDCGLTPLMFALMGGNVGLARLLIAQRAPKATETGYSDALKFAEALQSPADLKEELEKFETPAQKRAFRSWVQKTSTRTSRDRENAQGPPALSKRGAPTE